MGTCVCCSEMESAVGAFFLILLNWLETSPERQCHGMLKASQRWGTEVVNVQCSSWR